MRKARLDLSEWSAEDINNLPDMQVDGGVWLPDLKENNEIERIPILGLKVGGLNLTGCESLTSLPKGLKVEGIFGNLNLAGCESLTSLPRGLKVKGNLNLYKCIKLESLPEDLIFGGWLGLDGCESLTSLPAGLKISEDLDICSCKSLKYLPKDLEVKGRNIWYDSNTGFAKIEGFMDKPEIIPTHLRGKLEKI